MTVYLNELGIINALGADKESVWKALINQSQGSLSQCQEFIAGQSVFVGKVDSKLCSLPEHLNAFDNKNNQLLLTAFKQIENHFYRLLEAKDCSRIAIVLGTSTGAMDQAEVEYVHYLEGQGISADYNFINQEIGGGDEFLKQYLSLNNILHYTISTACSSSAKAIVAGRNLIENDMADIVIAGGADSLCKLTLNGFNALESLSSNICQPFSEDRDGINIGEGAALFLLSKVKSSVKFSGAGETSDAYHMSAPEPEGAGAAKAMSQALFQAKIQPQDVDYLNLHGTATRKNDEMEAKAVNQVFSGAQLKVSSTKHLTGHMLGSAGATEIGFCWLALNDNAKLPTNQPNIESQFSSLNFVLTAEQSEMGIKHCMSNSFAFGGNNISVVISRDE